MTPWDTFLTIVVAIVYYGSYLFGVGLILFFIFGALNWVHEMHEELNRRREEAGDTDPDRPFGSGAG